MNHIKNMGWITYLVFTKSGTDNSTVKDFVYVRIETIKTDYQDMEIATQPTDNNKKLKFRGLYTWLFNSGNESAQYFLAKESNNRHQSRPMTWKLHTTKILHSVKKEICCAQNMIHTLSLEKFDNMVKKRDYQA